MRRTGEQLARLAVLAVLLLPLVFRVVPAFAHATLIASEPADGVRLESAPGAVVLRFDEPVQPVQVRVLNREARELADPRLAHAVGDTVRLDLPASSSTGTFVVSYSVVSADSHPVAGSFIYSVGEPVDQAARPPATVGWKPWRIATVVNRALHLAALAVFAGGLLFLLLVPRRESVNGGAGALPSWLWLTSGAMAAITAIASVGLQGIAMDDAPLSGLLQAGAWQLGAETTRAIAAELALTGLALSALALWSEWRPLLWPAALVAVASLVASGHAVATPPRAFSLSLWTVHIVVAVFWIGSLVPLLRALQEGTVMPLRRFSALAVVAVPIALAAGVGMAVLQIADAQQLMESTYGNVLQLKVLLVGAMLSLAACNRWWLLPQLATDAGVARSLRTSIAAEVALGLLILGVTGLLSSQVPPRTASRPPAHVVLEASLGGGTAVLDLYPARPGMNTVRVSLRSTEGMALDVQELALSMSLPQARIEPIRRPLRRLGPGDYLYEGADLALPGPWTLKLEALVGDFERRSASVQATISE